MAANLQLVISAIDRASGTLGKVEGKTNALGRAFGTVLKVGALAAAGGIAATIPVAISSVKAASELNEAVNKAAVTFGKSIAPVSEFARTSAKQFGISRRAANEYAGTLGVILQASGLSQDATAGMSVDLTRLAADMASFNNIPIDQALEKIRSGLVGEAEPLRTVGVLLSEAAVATKAVELGLAPLGAKLTDAQKVQARYAIIMEQTTKAQGDFARTSDSLANRQRILGARFEDLRARIGQKLLPVAVKLSGWALQFIDLIERNQEEIEAFVKRGLERAIKVLQGFERATRPVLRVLLRLGNWFIHNKTAIQTAAVGIGAVLVTMFTAWAISAGAAAVATIAAAAPVYALVAAVAILAAGIFLLIKNFDKVKAFMIQWGPLIGAIILTAFFGPIPLIVALVIKFRSQIIGFFMDLKDKVLGVVTSLKDLLAGHWREIVAVALAILFPPGAGLFALVTNAGGVRDKVVGAIKGIWERIKGMTADFFGAGKALGNAIAFGVKGGINQMIVFVENGINAVLDALADGITLAKKIADAIPGPNPFGNKMQAAIDALREGVNLPRLQAGTRFFPGGLALLGEKGPELAVLPRATRVLSAAQSERMIAGPTTIFQFNAPLVQSTFGMSATDEERLERRIRAIVLRAARR